MTPTWADEVIQIDVKYVDEDVHFAVFDDEIGDDKSIGDCIVKLTSFGLAIPNMT